MVSNLIDDFLYKIYMVTEGESHVDYHRFVSREEGNDLLAAQKHIKEIQQDLEKTKNLPKDNEDIKKLN